MHELSLAMDVVDLVLGEAEKKKVSSVLEVEIEIGDISGVEYETFRTAMEISVKGTLLESTVLQLNRVKGMGKCSNCSHVFEMEQRVALCPLCSHFAGKIISGTEFRIVSLIVE
ncbi:MAG: hydrogenase maturation nickel metallochaperone HypA [Bacteroidetes bacterium]|nr:hydrogenase maturation nickel metallochaperone HypA [Bacteroidota bacterium]